MEEFLKKHGLSPKEQREFLDLAVVRTYGKNEYLLREGEMCETFAFLEQGIIAHEIISEKGDSIIKNFVIAPTFMTPSIYSFLTSQPSMAFCKAITEITVLEWSRQVYLDFADKPGWKTLFHELLVQFIVKKEQKEIFMLKYDARTRYEIFLTSFPNLLNQIPHHYIASYLNIKPQSLSRIRKMK